ncbi:fat storage-inducing transmembrane protein [Aplysia californica]|uniref:Fat storage-inducing transmembrane protein n=1 Tax=Aplysia californica TaxID=6500 RepID=A0ABM0KAJ1_APLCA|nr:fat storage-inducing transmembrane protein [Aplysia californica]
MANRAPTSSSSRRKSDGSGFQKKPGQNKPAGKKPLPEPTHIGHFIMMLIMKVCRMILFVDTSVKIGVYLIGVMFGSIICDLFVVPKTIFANSRNPLNQYFIKLGWAWTFTFVTAYIILTSLVYCCRDIPRMCQHILRIAVGTFWWYTCTSMFVHIEKVVGLCTLSSHGDKSSCEEAGRSWLGFDISGHVFLEIHCLLIISEELKTFKEWKKLGMILEDEDLKDKRRVSEEEIAQGQMNYKTLTPYIKILVLCISVIFVLFEFMLLISTIYRFHTLSQKVTASFVAVICWFLSYRVIFRSACPFPFVPVMPGYSLLNFMKIS